MALHVRKGDLVEIIAGDHKGQQGKVLRVMPKEGLVIVEGINMVYRHMKPSRRYPQGGRIQKEAPIHISNVLPVDPKTGKGTRVWFKVERNSAGKVVSKQRMSTAGTALSDVTRTTKTATGGSK